MAAALSTSMPKFSPSIDESPDISSLRSVTLDTSHAAVGWSVVCANGLLRVRGALRARRGWMLRGGEISASSATKEALLGRRRNGALARVPDAGDKSVMRLVICSILLYVDYSVFVT